MLFIEPHSTKKGGTITTFKMTFIHRGYPDGAFIFSSPTNQTGALFLELPNGFVLIIPPTNFLWRQSAIQYIELSDVPV